MMTHQQLQNKLPNRLVSALNSLIDLNKIGLYLLPIRHHSPACAYAVKQALNDLHPTDVLIEAPASFNTLLEDLQHSDNKPPLAILCQTQVSYPLVDIESKATESRAQTGQYYRSAYFPFCDYSPEWVGLRHTSASLQHVECIDLPWHQQVAYQEERISGKSAEESRSLQQERYFAHSEYIKALASKLHCRDHDEVWSHLFELRCNEQLRNWRGFFQDVLVWCAMSRLDYEEDVLAIEGSLIREDYMVERIIHRHTSQHNKTAAQAAEPQKIVVITGGFHTLALIEALHNQLIKNTLQSKSVLRSRTPITQPNQMVNTSPDDAWLIRYSFDRLDALNGYASGMPSPAFYQSCWEQRLAQDALSTHSAVNESSARRQFVVNFISDFSKKLRAEQIIQSSYITVKTASEQAIRLAELREHPLVAHYDLIDACTSSFLKGSSDEGYHLFYQRLNEQLSGAKLGEVVSSTRTPPILTQVYQLVKANHFKLDDTLSKTTKLDVLRNPKHRERSRLLHLLTFLDLGFARRINGPDFLQGSQLHLLFEEWQYAWTPQVEARLIELAEQGSDIYYLAAERLLSLRQDDADQGQNQSSSEVSHLLIQASMMGLNEQMTVLFKEMMHILPNDPDLSSVLSGAQQLLYLWTGKSFLQLNSAQFNGEKALVSIIKAVPATALFLLAQCQTPSEDQVNSTLINLLAMRNVLKQIHTTLSDDTEHTTRLDDSVLNDFHHTLQRLLPSWQDISLLTGAVQALQFIDGVINEADLALSLQQRFGIGAQPEQAVAYLTGMMQAVPTLFLHYSDLIKMIDYLVAKWDNDTFIALLPDLRLAFTGLKPMQTHALASQISELHNTSAASVIHHQNQLSETDLLQGVVLNQHLEGILVERGLLDWVGCTL